MYRNRNNLVIVQAVVPPLRPHPLISKQNIKFCRWDGKQRFSDVFRGTVELTKEKWMSILSDMSDKLSLLMTIYHRFNITIPAPT